MIEGDVEFRRGWWQRMRLILKLVRWERDFVGDEGAAATAGLANNEGAPASAYFSEETEKKNVEEEHKVFYDDPSSHSQTREKPERAASTSAETLLSWTSSSEDSGTSWGARAPLLTRAVGSETSTSSGWSSQDVIHIFTPVN